MNTGANNGRQYSGETIIEFNDQTIMEFEDGAGIREGVNKPFSSEQEASMSVSNEPATMGSSGILDGFFGSQSYGSPAASGSYHSSSISEAPLTSFLRPNMTLQDGRYTIKRVINAKSTFVVYEAFDRQQNMTVAIKELFPADIINRTQGEKRITIYGKNRSEDFEKYRERFVKEANSLILLNTGKNIVKAREYFEENNTIYLIMECLRGKRLDEFIAAHGGRLDINTTNRIACGILDGLAALHRINVLYENITPENVFITEENAVKLIDLSAARFLKADTKNPTNTEPDPSFAAPEMFSAEDSKHGPWTDIYMVGALYYYMITGELLPDTITRMEQNNSISLHKKADLIPDYIDRTVMLALEPNSNRRIQTVEQMKSGLNGTMIKSYADIQKERKKSMIVIGSAVGGAVLLALIVVLLILFL